MFYTVLRYKEACSAGDAPRALALARLGAFLTGIGLSNQHAIVFYALPIIVYAVILDSFASRQLQEPVIFGSLVACGLVGLSPYGDSAAPAALPSLFVHISSRQARPEASHTITANILSHLHASMAPLHPHFKVASAA